MMSRDGLINNGLPRSLTAIVLAHGAGAGMDTDFTGAFAEGLADCGCQFISGDHVSRT
jgi:predicted alpha/beta-hydrolase family hydrolase